MFIQSVLESEGYPGYVDHPHDTGGETLAGISRKWNPDWPGWQMVDEAKLLSGFPGNLESYPLLRGLVEDFYSRKYWDALRSDSLWSMSEMVTMEILDAAVNHGTRTAIRMLQRSLNVRNKMGSWWPDIVSDGRMGSKTLGALSSSLASTGVKRTLLGFVIVRGSKYLQIAERNESQESFIDGWLDRLQIEINPRR